jgi:hypothetical protein
MPQVLRSQFPQSESKLKRLVSEHLKLQDEPLLLALYYAPDREQQDIFLFEVLDGFGGNSVSPDRNLFEVTYGTSPAFAMKRGQQLHLVLTNPIELKLAFRDGWELAKEIRDAVRRNDYRVIHQDEGAAELLEIVRGR